MEYTILVQKDPDSGWYVGRCVQVPGAVSQGETLDELMDNMKDAISLVLDYYRDEAHNEYKQGHSFYRKLAMA